MESNQNSLEQLIAEFDSLFPTAEACLNELVRRRAARFRRCKRCRGKYVRLKGGRVLKCRSCGQSVRIFVNTVFERMRRPRAWLAALWLLERRVIFSANAFHKHLGIAFSTALFIIKVLSHVSLKFMAPDSSVASSEFAGIVCKRSKETEARKPPRSEEDSLVKPVAAGSISPANQQISISSANDELASLTLEFEDPKFAEIEKVIYEFLSETQKHTVDEIRFGTGIPYADFSPTLGMLLIKGLIKDEFGRYYRLPANRKRAVRSAEHATVINTFMQTVKAVFQGVSRKYLQNYLALLSWCFEPRADRKKNRLIAACFDTAPISCKEIMNYVSPAVVRIPLIINRNAQFMQISSVQILPFLEVPTDSHE